MREAEGPKNVEKGYNKWCDFLEQEVKFWLKTSEKYTKEHCSRVMLFALLIGDRMRILESEKSPLPRSGIS